MIPKLAARALPALLLLGCGSLHAQGWLETRVAIEDFVIDEDLESATALGDDLLTKAEAEFGATSTQLVDAHILLASIYRQDANFEDAELHLLRAIDIVELRDGELSTTLIQPLVTLGETYFEARDFELSLATFEEARAIGRRAFGLLNFEQLEIIDRMTAAALSMLDFDQAHEFQRQALAIVQRTHGEKSIEFIDAKFRLAAWYLRYGESEAARRTFLEIERIVDDFTDDPLLAIRVLRTKAVVMRNGTEATRDYRTNPLELEQALKLAEELPERDPLLEAEILRDMGDWYVSLSIGANVAEPYEKAWAMLDSVEDGFDHQHEWFGPLTSIRIPPFDSRLVSREPDAPWGRIEIAFRLDTQGRAHEVRIRQSVPAGLLDDVAIRHILGSRFRPRMDRGALIESDAVIGWDFQYDPSFVEALTASGPAAE